MPIVYAGRISMAAPLVFTAPIYQGVVYRDGGLGNNFPTDVVHQGKSGVALDQSHAETMLFAYEAFDEAQRNLFQHHEKKTSAPIPPGFLGWVSYMGEWLAKRQAGAMQFREFNLADSNRVWNSGPQTTVVYHGDIDFADFGAAEFRKDFAVAQSKMMATEQVALRANLAYNTVFEDPGKAAKAIPPEERQEVLDSLTDDSAMTAQLRLELTRLLNQTQPA
jgi:predicted acylesterase/phospholipase RssA